MFVIGSVRQRLENLSFSSVSKWKTGEKLTSLGCDANGKFTIILHGWRDATVATVPTKFLKYRGGCVIFVDYQKCISMWNYFTTLFQWKSVIPLVTQKLRDMENEGISPGNVLVYGFSLGARIAIEAVLEFGKGKLEALDREFEQLLVCSRRLLTN